MLKAMSNVFTYQLLTPCAPLYMTLDLVPTTKSDYSKHEFNCNKWLIISGRLGKNATD